MLRGQNFVPATCLHGFKMIWIHTTVAVTKVCPRDLSHRMNSSCNMSPRFGASCVLSKSCLPTILVIQFIFGEKLKKLKFMFPLIEHSFLSCCIFQTLFYYYFFKAPPVARPAQSPSAGGSFIIPQPSKRSPAKQPVSDLLGDLGGDPFAQSAGKSTLRMCQHYC